MRFCENCGKELLDEAVMCPHCYVKLGTAAAAVSVRPKTKIQKWWIILGAAVLVVALIAAILFMPRNLEMDDFKKVNVFTAVINYGIPDRIKTNDDGETYLVYKDKIDFYGYPSSVILVYPEEDKITLSFSKDGSKDVYKKINRYCEFEKNLSGIYHVFSYGDIEITTYDYDASFIIIEING